MLGLQVSIGALNDLVDAPRDAGTKPGKPIPRGAATPAEARGIAIGGLLVAIVLLVPSGPAALLVLAACAACGYAYDLRLSRTAISWLPLALALPLVPVFAWVGATGGVPDALVAIVPAGILAGAGLALANALADVERDRSVGASTAAVRLGARRTWLLQAGLLVGAVAIVVAARPAALIGSGTSAGPGTLRLVTLLAGVLALLIGIALAGRNLDRADRVDRVVGRSRDADGGIPGGAGRRERAWELEAVGIALVAAGWLASLATG